MIRKIKNFIMSRVGILSDLILLKITAAYDFNIYKLYKIAFSICDITQATKLHDNPIHSKLRPEKNVVPNAGTCAAILPVVTYVRSKTFETNNES